MSPRLQRLGGVKAGVTVMVPLECSNQATIIVWADGSISVETWQNIAMGWVPVVANEWKHYNLEASWQG